METLFNVFKIILCIAGIVLMVEILFALILTPIINYRNKKRTDKALEDIKKIAIDCLKDVEKEKKSSKKKSTNTKVKQEN